MVRKDLLRQLKKWREKGDRVVLMMDANKDVIDGVIWRQLSNKAQGIWSGTANFIGSPTGQRQIKNKCAEDNFGTALKKSANAPMKNVKESFSN